MAVPYTFSTATGSLPLSQLDSNFSTAITIGNTAVVLGDSISTINNLVLANVAITSVATQFPNGYLANSNVIVGTTTLTLGSTVTTVDGLTLSNVTISSGNVTITNVSVTTANATTANVGTLIVRANATVGGNVTITGNVSAANGTFTSANVSGTANVSTLAVISNVTIGGNATVTGNVSMNVATITTANVTTANTSSLVVTGNQTFVGTGNRILGDFTNATTASRVAFQTSTTNGNTSLLVLPNGTATIAGADLFNNSDPTNAAYFSMQSRSTESRLQTTITGTGTYVPMTFYTGGSERMRVDTSGNVGIGTTSPTAVLMLKAGTATASTAPLKLTSGTNLTTPEAGAVEYDGTVFYGTTDTNFKRGTLPITNYTSGTGTALGTNTEATNAVLLPSANDTITLSVGTYFLDVSYIVTRGATSVTSATARINIRGSGAAVGNFSGMSLSAPTAGGATANFSFDAVNITTDNVLTAASTTAAGVYTISLRGILKITTSGTIIPQYSLSANINAAGTVAKVLYFRLQQLDTQSAAAAGPAGTGWA